jgi:hypothetical protein
MDIYKIFSTEKERNEAVEHFNNLKSNQDWIFLVEKLIKSDIEDITNEILDPTKEWKPGEEGDSKRQRAYWIILSELPDKLIQALVTKQEDIFEDQDPYFKNTKEIIQSQRKR